MVRMKEIKEVLVQEGVITKQEIKEIEGNAKERYKNMIDKTEDNTED